MTIERIIGVVFSGFTAKLAGASLALWLAGNAAITLVDAMERVTSAIN